VFETKRVDLKLKNGERRALRWEEQTKGEAPTTWVVVIARSLALRRFGGGDNLHAQSCIRGGKKVCQLIAITLMTTDKIL
jgi:hypothetical protein